MERDGAKEDKILEYAIKNKLRGRYQEGLSMDKKRAVRKRMQALTLENGEIFIQRKKNKVKVVTSVEDQKRILHSCHSDPTSGHFGVTKTWRRLAERFYWKWMCQEARDLVMKCTVSVDEQKGRHHPT